MADSRFHKNAGPFTIKNIANVAGCTIEIGDGDTIIHDVAPLKTASSGQISFLDNVKYNKDLANTLASACIIHPKMVEFAPKGVICLVTDTPYKAYAKTAAMFYPQQQSPVNGDVKIHPTAYVSDKAIVHDSVVIEANSVIGDGVEIGEKSYIGTHVSITHSIIGNNVRIHNGARIGQDGFGFAIDHTGAMPVPQLGRVIIEDHVNIGSNTCIDRGSGPDTIIGTGTTIDNLVQIAHNVVIGKGCVITSQVGISGSTKIDNYCVFGGQSGVAGHLHIGAGSQIGAQSGVTKDIAAGSKMMGFPARPIREFWRDMAQIKKLLSK